MINKIFVVLVLLFFTQSCVLYKLERVLEPDIKSWYELHYPLMNSKVPLWIDANNRTERSHFLHFPSTIQRVYISMFWKIRHDGVREIFYNRLAYVNRRFGDFSNPWHSDRGRIFLLLGPPMYELYYHDGIQTVDTSMPCHGDVLVWCYYDPRVGQAMFRFTFIPPNDWRLNYNNGLRDVRNHEAFKRLSKEFFAPSKDGWDLWADTLYNLVSKKG